MVAAIYWRRLTAAGAIASVIATASVWATLFYRAEFGANELYAFPEPDSFLLDWGIPPMLPVATITLCSAVTLVLVSLITRPPQPETIGRFFLHEKVASLSDG